METICLVTGVSAGESQKPNVEFLQRYYPGVHIELFDPEQYMEQGPLAAFADLFDFTNRTYDVFAYMGALRDEIDKHFQGMIQKYQPQLVIAHSLGTVITGRNMSLGKVSLPDVILMNSPLWIPFYSEIQGLKTPCNWLQVLAFYSSNDLISKCPLDKNKFKIRGQWDIKTGHPFQESWAAAWIHYKELMEDQNDSRTNCA